LPEQEGADAFSEFHDPRLVALYDRLNPPGDDANFYISLAGELGAERVIDLGCGTGIIACELARRGHDVIGVDPSREMLGVARGRDAGGLVRWVEGDASDLEDIDADLAIMSAHVAQVIHDEVAWRRTLAGLQRGLRSGGRLAFESRNPDARAWLGWVPESSYQRHDDVSDGPLDVWFELNEAAGDLVRYEIHYRFGRTGEELVSPGTLRFRSRASLTQSLGEAGFSVQDVFGDWDRSPLSATSPELIFLAVRD
jgi:SAM-dependent methyltransferase